MGWRFERNDLGSILSKTKFINVERGSLRYFQYHGLYFCIIIGATVFAFVVRALGGDEIIEEALTSLPFSDNGIILFVIFCVFLLGFFLDWIEITFIVCPCLSQLLGPWT